MSRYRLQIAYDGTRFLGWQKTRMGPSIQEELERAFFRLTQKTIIIEGASRTDRGVHARGQVIHAATDYFMPCDKLRRALNAALPNDISIKAVVLVDDEFHATLNARSKEYQYFICNQPVQLPFHRLYSWHVHQHLTLESMHLASKYFIGTHDFTSFANQSIEQPICTIYDIQIHSLNDQRLVIIIHGDRFLYKMVRNIVGTLIYVGRSILKADVILQILEDKNRTSAGITAPAHGLFLNKVFYSIPE